MRESFLTRRRKRGYKNAILQFTLPKGPASSSVLFSPLPSCTRRDSRRDDIKVVLLGTPLGEPPKAGGGPHTACGGRHRGSEGGRQSGSGLTRPAEHAARPALHTGSQSCACRAPAWRRGSEHRSHGTERWAVDRAAQRAWRSPRRRSPRRLVVPPPTQLQVRRSVGWRAAVGRRVCAIWSAAVWEPRRF